MILERAQSHVEMVPDAGALSDRCRRQAAAADADGRAARCSAAPTARRSIRGGGRIPAQRHAAPRRRGRRERRCGAGGPAARIIWGNQASVLVGDFLLGQAFMMMVETGELECARGAREGRDDHRRGRSVPARSKTRDLDDDRRGLRRSDPRQDCDAVRGGVRSRRDGGRRRCGRAARRCATTGANSAWRSSWSTTCSTIAARAATMGKNTGDDLREGKMTLPVILALAEGNAGGARDDRSRRSGKTDASEGAAARQCVAIFEKHKTLDRTLDKARGHMRGGPRGAAACCRQSTMRGMLGDIAEFTVHGRTELRQRSPARRRPSSPGIRPRRSWAAWWACALSRRGRRPWRPSPTCARAMQPWRWRMACDQVADQRDERDRRRLEVVAGFVEPEAELAPGGSAARAAPATPGLSWLLEAAEDVGGDDRHQRIDQHQVAGGEMPRAAWTISPMPRTSQGARRGRRGRRRRGSGRGRASSASGMSPVAESRP